MSGIVPIQFSPHANFSGGSPSVFDPFWVRLERHVWQSAYLRSPPDQALLRALEELRGGVEQAKSFLTSVVELRREVLNLGHSDALPGAEPSDEEAFWEWVRLRPALHRTLALAVLSQGEQIAAGVWETALNSWRQEAPEELPLVLETLVALGIPFDRNTPLYLALQAAGELWLDPRPVSVLGQERFRACAVRRFDSLLEQAAAGQTISWREELEWMAEQSLPASRGQTEVLIREQVELWSNARSSPSSLTLDDATIRALIELLVEAQSSPRLHLMANILLGACRGAQYSQWSPEARQTWPEILAGDFPLYRLSSDGWGLFAATLAGHDPAAPLSLWCLQQDRPGNSMHPGRLLDSVAVVDPRCEEMGKEFRHLQHGLRASFEHLKRSPLGARTYFYLQENLLRGLRAGSTPLRQGCLRLAGFALEEALSAGLIRLDELNWQGYSDAPTFALYAFCCPRATPACLQAVHLHHPLVSQMAQVALEIHIESSSEGKKRELYHWHDLLIVASAAANGVDPSPSQEAFLLCEACRQLEVTERADRSLTVTAASLNATLLESLRILKGVAKGDPVFLAHRSMVFHLSAVADWVAGALFFFQERPSQALHQELLSLHPALIEILMGWLVIWRLRTPTNEEAGYLLQDLVPALIKRGHFKGIDSFLKWEGRLGRQECWRAVMSSESISPHHLMTILRKKLAHPGAPFALSDHSLIIEQMKCLRAAACGGGQRAPAEVIINFKLLIALMTLQGSRLSPQHPDYSGVQEALVYALELFRSMPRLEVDERDLNVWIEPLIESAANIGLVSSEERQQRMKLLAAALHAGQRSPTALIERLPPVGPLDDGQILITSVLLELSGNFVSLACLPWITLMLANEPPARLQLLLPLHRRLVGEVLHTTMPTREGVVRLVDLLDCPAASPLIHDFFMDDTVDGPVRLSVCSWWLQKGCLSDINKIVAWILTYTPQHPGRRARLNAAAHAMILHRGTRGADFLPSPRGCGISPEELEYLMQYVSARLQLDVSQVKFLFLPTLVELTKAEPMPLGFWQVDRTLAFWVWVYRAGGARTAAELQSELAYLNPAALAAQIQLGPIAQLKGIHPSLSELATKIFELPFEQISAFHMILGQLAEWGPEELRAMRGLLAVLSAHPLEWWSKQNLVQGLTLTRRTRGHRYAGALTTLQGELAPILQVMMDKGPRWARMIGAALLQVPIFHASPLLMLRARADGNRQAPIWHAVDTAPPWVLEDFQRTLADPSRPFTWLQVALTSEFEWRSLWIELVRQPAALPTHWRDLDLAQQREWVEARWQSLLQDVGDAESLQRAWITLRMLLQNPVAPRNHRAPEQFKSSWLERLAAFPVDENDAPAVRRVVSCALFSGLSDLNPAVCSAGWDQVLSAMEDALGAAPTLDLYLKLNLGRTLRQHMIDLLGMRIGTPEDAHLKNKVKIACHDYPSNRSIGGLSAATLEKAWSDAYPLQDPPDQRPILLARLNDHPELPAAHPASSSYDRRVAFMIRRELPRVWDSLQLLDQVAEIIRRLPEEAEGIDLRSVAKRCAEWLTDLEELQYQLAAQIFQHLRDAQFAQQSTSPVLRRIALILACACGVVKISHDAPEWP